MRTKMSKADAGRTIEALFDDKGIIAAELKKGAKVQITGFGNFEARKRAARTGRNPKTGGVIQIKASIAPAFRAGKQLKMAVNNRGKRSEEHTSELQSQSNLVCRLLLEKKKKKEHKHIRA